MESKSTMDYNQYPLVNWMQKIVIYETKAVSIDL